MILSDDDLVAVTKKLRPTAQARVLARLGIEHRRRPDGSLLVLWAAVEAGATAGRGARIAAPEPDWSAVSAA